MTADRMDRGEAFDWDTSELDEDSGFRLLEEGTYPFIVTGLERSRFEGSDKMAPCPKAIVSLAVILPDGTMPPLEESLLLNSKMAFKVSQFFKSIGAPVDPETRKVRIDWNGIEGKEGMAKVGIRTYAKRDGSEGKANQVERFLSPDEAAQAKGEATAEPQQTAMEVPSQPAASPQPHSTYEL